MSYPLNETLDVHFPAYLAHEAISRGDIVACQEKTLDFYRRRKLQPTREKKESPAKKLGRAMHSAALEPEDFIKKWGCYEERKGTKVYKAWLGENSFHPDNVLTTDQYLWVYSVNLRIKKIPQVARTMAEGAGEQTVFFEDHITGLLCKARFDWWNPHHGVILDPKSTESLNDRDLVRTCRAYGYDIQAVQYMEAARLVQGLGPIDWDAPPGDLAPFILLWISKEIPIETRMWELPMPALQHAAARRRLTLNTIAECEKTNVWPGWPQKIITPDWPEWALQ